MIEYLSRLSFLGDYLPRMEPIWPGFLVVGAAGVLVVLTFLTYATSRRAERNPRRWLLLLGLRLLALAIALMVILRPSWDHSEVNRLPGKLLVVFDASKSMTVKDEDPNLTRWQAALREWQAVQDQLPELAARQNLRVLPFAFDTKVREFRAEEPPEGEQTGLAAALDLLYERNKPLAGGEGETLLGMVVLTDGRENVGRPALEGVIAKLARGNCPVHTIGMGQPGGSEHQPDLIALNIDAPAVARIKDRMVVRGVIQAQRFENRRVQVELLINGQPAPEAADGAVRPVVKTVTPQNANQIIPIEMPPCRLPDQPGDIRMSLRIIPQPGELTETNNEVSTFISLTKEGLSVAYFDKERFWESTFIRRALKGDERITPYQYYLGEDRGEVATKWRRDLLNDLQKTKYDVFIIGDMPASRFIGEGPDGMELLRLIEKRVKEGAGLLMIGGQASFAAGKWNETPLAAVLPVDMAASGNLEGQPGSQKQIKFTPTQDALRGRHFVLRLDAEPEANRQWWESLPPLDGGSRVGNRRDLARVLAESQDQDILLAVQDYGAGRSAALAVDTTWRWVGPGEPRNPADRGKPGAISAGTEAHLRFWRQLILWLAKQEEAGKSVRIELDRRRLVAGKEQTVTVQAREITPGGARDATTPIKNAVFTVKIIKPNKTEEALSVVPDGGEEGKAKGLFWKTEEPGEYEVVVSAVDAQGKDLGTAKARFQTYRDDSELLNRSANHALLEQLAAATAGSHRLHGGLRDVLELVGKTGANQLEQKFRFPDWSEPNDRLQGGLLALFLLCICGEWALRRWWGWI
jgi:hypothetical protein